MLTQAPSSTVIRGRDCVLFRNQAVRRLSLINMSLFTVHAPLATTSDTVLILLTPVFSVILCLSLLSDISDVK